MSTNQNTRMTIDIPSDDHRRLKALSAIQGKSMREIVSEWIHSNLYSENAPNPETLQAIESIEKGENLVKAKDTEDLFRKLGMPH